MQGTGLDGLGGLFKSYAPIKPKPSLKDTKPTCKLDKTDKSMVRIISTKWSKPFPFDNLSLEGS